MTDDQIAALIEKGALVKAAAVDGGRWRYRGDLYRQTGTLYLVVAGWADPNNVVTVRTEVFTESAEARRRAVLVRSGSGAPGKEWRLETLRYNVMHPGESAKLAIDYIDGEAEGPISKQTLARAKAALAGAREKMDGKKAQLNRAG